MAQFFAEGEMVEISPELKELFENWVNLTPEQKKAAKRRNEHVFQIVQKTFAACSAGIHGGTMLFQMVLLL